MISGKEVEQLVAFAEEAILGKGFQVSLNKREFDEDGNSVAEFDIVLAGRVGSTDFRWLIECRDRPSSGAAPGSWIEQLVGRRSRFGFHKVTAVSTTGFSPSAVAAAFQSGIELRRVQRFSPDQFSDWMGMTEIAFRHRHSNLKKVTVNLDPNLGEDGRAAVKDVLDRLADTPAVLIPLAGAMNRPEFAGGSLS